jgi:protein associated with RNAse G/E
MSTKDTILIVVKLNIQREETWRYTGRMLKKDQNSLLIDACFNREDLHFHGIVFKENDRFIERYFADRWYNIFELHDRDDGHLKGWYCNVTLPAEFSPGKIAYVDLALDLLVYPDGKYLVLDEDEFSELPLNPAVRQKARQGLNELIEIVKTDQLAKLLK